MAGCTSVTGDDSGRKDEAQQTDESGSPRGGPLTLQFGETAVFTNDESVELEVTPTDARLTEAVVVGGKGGNAQVSARTPEAEDAMYLLVTFRLTNEGSAETKVPGGLFFTAAGEESSRTILQTPGQEYHNLEWVKPGETVEGTAAFEAPADADSGSVEARFRTIFQSPPVRWELDLTNVPRETFDFDGLAPGETIEFGTEEYRYSFAALGKSETGSYEASNGEKRTAADEKRFVLVEVESENVGTSPVTLPTAYDMRLLAAGSEFRAGRYERVEDRYTGGKSDPGQVMRGEVLFEVPESASVDALQVTFGNGPVGTWKFE